MRLKLTLERQNVHDDIQVTVDSTVTVHELASAIHQADPLTIDHQQPGLTLAVLGVDEDRTLPGTLAVADAGVRSGDIVTVIGEGSGAAGPAPSAGAQLEVLSGPDAGRTFSLHFGINRIGRSPDNHIQLSDPLVSRQHASVVVGESVEVVDQSSANGIFIGGVVSDRAVVGAHDEIAIGDTVFRVVQLATSAVNVAAGPIVEFVRSARLDPVYEGEQFTAPTPPQPPQPARFPLIPLLAPIAMGSVMYLITRNPLSVLFVALSPFMMVGSFFEQRFGGRRQFREQTQQFRSALKDIAIQMSGAAEREVKGRLQESPATMEVVRAARSRDPLLWTRRVDRRGFLQVRVGLGRRHSRNELELPKQNNTTPELWRELQVTGEEFSEVDGVPVLADFVEHGVVGIAGASERRIPIGNAFVSQVAGLHSPAEVVLFTLASTDSSTPWQWLRWLPHSSSEHSPIRGAQLADSPGACRSVVSSLEELVVARGGEAATPAVVVVVEDDAPIDRSRLVTLAETGPASGVHLLWMADSITRLPAACRAFVDAGAAPAVAGFIEDGKAVELTDVEQLDEGWALAAARDLSPVIDSGALIQDDSDLPRSISTVSLLGHDVVKDAAAIVERWSETDSLPRPTNQDPVRRKEDATLRALIGQGSTGPVHLDLRTQGPHALVGGTTGSGKSEFLRSWVIGMAASHSPTRVNFMLVDYKASAAFAECVNLPHTVGLVTNLNPHLVRRVLNSLRAELNYRIDLLNQKRAEDLIKLERTGDPESPPSLVIVVDEFAALAKEIPEFVDGVVDIAARGRSLGIHLILATQRPAGVINDNIRANTDLRVALRMADAEDSKDVLGIQDAAFFDPSLKGRGMAKLGPGRVTPFQAGYVGGWTTENQGPPPIDVHQLDFGVGGKWEPPRDDAADAPRDLGPTDLERLVEKITQASAAAGVPEPRVPFQPELAAVIDMAEVLTDPSDEYLEFALSDDPDRQLQSPAAFRPSRDGNMAVFGTGGSGKTTVLRSLAHSAAFSSAVGPCHVYGLDWGQQGLRVLEDLPHVGAIVASQDRERLRRLLDWLGAQISERSNRYLDHGGLDAYRLATGEAEPRILLLVDNFGAFREDFDGAREPYYSQLQRIIADGRSAGVHVIMTADRLGAIPSTIASNVQQRLVLRQASSDDYGDYGVAKDVVDTESPAGRGVYRGLEVQVAVTGGSADLADQNAALLDLAPRLAKQIPARPIRRMPALVEPHDLPDGSGSRVPVGLDFAEQQPAFVDLSGPFAIAGPNGATVRHISEALLLKAREAAPQRQIIVLARQAETVRAFTGLEATIIATAEEWTSFVARENGGRVAGVEPDALVYLHRVEDFAQDPMFVNTPADLALQRFVQGHSGAGRGGVVASGNSEGAGFSSFGWPLLNIFRRGVGILLAPTPEIASSALGASIERISLEDLPDERGFLLGGPKPLLVQFASVRVGE